MRDKHVSMDYEFDEAGNTSMYMWIMNLMKLETGNRSMCEQVKYMNVKGVLFGIWGKKCFSLLFIYIYIYIFQYKSVSAKTLNVFLSMSFDTFVI